MDDLIPAWDILQKIGAYLVEIPDTAPVVVINIEKKIYDSLTSMRLYQLTNDDADLLFRLFKDSGLDLGFLLSGKCPKTDYEQFRQAFYASKDKPDWHMQPYFHDIKHKAKCDRDNAIHSHFDLMTKAAVDGEIALLSQTHVPIFRPESYARITREDAKKYLNKFSLPLSLLEETPLEPVQTIKSKQELPPHQYTPEQQALFDPLPRDGITELFDIPGLGWKKLFDRAARIPGLKDAREGNTKPFQYHPAKVASWLVREGYIKQHLADTRLANNLPARNKDSKHLITGDLPD